MAIFDLLYYCSGRCLKKEDIPYSVPVPFLAGYRIWKTPDYPAELACTSPPPPRVGFGSDSVLYSDLDPTYTEIRIGNPENKIGCVLRHASVDAKNFSDFYIYIYL